MLTNDSNSDSASANSGDVAAVSATCFVLVVSYLMFWHSDFLLLQLEGLFRHHDRLIVFCLLY